MKGNRASEFAVESRIELTARRARKPGPSAQVGVSWADGLIQLRDEDLFGKRRGNQCAVFLRRVFALDEVKWVEIDRDQSIARIHYDSHRSGLVDVLHRLATAVRGQLPAHAVALPEGAALPDLSRATGWI